MPHPGLGTGVLVPGEGTSQSCKGPGTAGVERRRGGKLKHTACEDRGRERTAPPAP